MIMGQDAGCGVLLKCGFDDFAGVDAAAVDGAAKQFLETENAVTVIQP
jgi:hypothetical protein